MQPDEINWSDYMTPMEFAEVVGVATKTVTRALGLDQERSEEKKRFPGAFKIGIGTGIRWFIPRHLTETWQRDARGRK